MHFSRYLLALAVCASALTACGSDSTETPAAKDLGSAQLPPTSNGSDVEAWIAKGSYMDWTCETASHPQIKVSPHGKNRICSNDLISGFKGAVGDERPKGSAAVKELYNDSDELVGYAVSVKLEATSNGGANWYWYERTPSGVVADGKGDAGAAKSICVSCHAGAASDNDMHFVNGSSDYVYDVITN
jgi:hypothetical protein